MSLWPPLQVLITICLFLACAEITQPFVNANDDYYSYAEFPNNENETMNVTEQEITVISSVFDLGNYNNACNGSEMNVTERICESETMEYGSRKTCGEFQNVVKSMMQFSCSLSEYDAEIAMNKSTDYLNNCQDRYACAESVDIVRTLTTGLQMCNTTEGDFLNLIYKMQSIMDLQTKFGLLNQTCTWKLMVKEQKTLINGLEKYIRTVEDSLDYLMEQNLTNIFLTNVFDSRTSLPSLKQTLIKQNTYLLYCQENEAEWREIDVIRYDVRLATNLIFFIVGITGNILLLAVFIKYSDMRTTANVMLINLTVIDCICLVLNLPLSYLKSTSIWPLGEGGCQAFYFIRNITICVSTYSVVTISVQRFLAVTRFPTAGGCTIGEKTKIIIMLSCVWLLAVLYSLPRVIFSGIFMGMCSDVTDELIGIMTTIDLVMICVLPTLVMTVFSYLTATKIKKSVSNPTGERTGQEQLRRDRMLSANVLTVLGVLFAVSYFPSFLLYFIRFQIEISIGNYEMYVVDTVTYVLQFTNSCLNPIALCIMSRKYRKYFQEILSCCKIPLGLQKSLAASAASVSTTESTI